MATANDFGTLLKHLPVRVQSSLEKLPLATRASILGRLLVRKSIESQGGQLNKSADGRGLELVNREGQEIVAERGKITLVSVWWRGGEMESEETEDRTGHVPSYVCSTCGDS